MSGNARRSRNFFRDLMNWNSPGNEDGIKPEFIPTANLITTVYDGIVANNTTIATTTVLNYGVNVVTTVTLTNKAVRLPQPVVGKVVKVVNLGANPLSVFPYTASGKINNYSTGTAAVIPADGKIYEFVCLNESTNSVWSASDVSAELPYKSYTVSVTTPGGAQVPTINHTIENTIGPISWSYINTGVYRLTLNGAFDPNKTVAYVLNDITNLGSASFYLANNNYIDLICIDMSSNPTNNLLYSAIVEVRVYN